MEKVIVSKGITVKFLVVSADKVHSNFMSACDVFEKGKVLGDTYEMTIEYKDTDPEIVDLQRTADNLFPIIKQSLEKTGQIVSLIHLICLETPDVTYNNNNKVIPYWNKEVRVISTGLQWYPFHNQISSLGFHPELDEHIYITNIKK